MAKKYDWTKFEGIGMFNFTPEELDFVVRSGSKLWAIEVKSGIGSRSTGLEAFRIRFRNARPLLVGGGGIPLVEFFQTHPTELLGVIG